MRGTPKMLLATGILACCLSACSGIAAEDMPVREGPQTQTPHSSVTPGQPLRGIAVAVDLAQQL